MKKNFYLYLFCDLGKGAVEVTIVDVMLLVGE